MPTAATNWKGVIGKSFTLTTFDAYCHGLQWVAWRPSFVVLHNTGTPTLLQRPQGLNPAAHSQPGDLL